MKRKNYPLRDRLIRKFFFLQIAEVEMPFDKQKNQRKGFCFITFDSEQVVNELLKTPKQTISGKEVDVKRATPKPGMEMMMRGGGAVRGGPRGMRGGRGEKEREDIFVFVNSKETLFLTQYCSVTVSLQEADTIRAGATTATGVTTARTTTRMEDTTATARISTITVVTVTTADTTIRAITMVNTIKATTIPIITITTRSKLKTNVAALTRALAAKPKRRREVGGDSCC